MTWTRNLHIRCDHGEGDCHRFRIFWPWDLGQVPNEDGRYKLPSIIKGRAELKKDGWTTERREYVGVKYTADLCPKHSQ